MESKTPIMLVEDDHVDVMNVKRALKDLNIINPLLVRSNGEDALLYLRDNGNKKPGVILLDLNMPKMNGIEFLEIAKKDPVLRTIPVVVLTTSDTEQDTNRSFELGAAGYMVKPVDYKQFVEVSRVIHLYWTLSLMPGD